jgi:PAS domain S-box-containing protein
VLINSIPDEVWFADQKKNFTLVNEAAQKEFTNGHGSIETNVEKLIESLEILNPDGSPRTVEEAPSLRALRGEVVVSQEEIVRTPSSKQLRYRQVSSSPVKGINGSIIGSISVVRDITEQKKAEAELKKNQFDINVLNEKLRVTGSLTRHDVNNKLMIVRSNVYLLKKRLGDNPELIKYLDTIDSAIKATDKLLEFSRMYEKIGAEKPADISIGATFEEAIDLFSNLPNIKILNECQSLTVKADSLLRQLFYNLIDNSLRHGEKVTQVKLYCEKVKDDLKLVYEDDGVGILEKNKPNLFSEGFTTGKGSGLGLRLIKRMVEVYGWIITEEGKFGEGVKFVITIPSSKLS